LLPFIVAGITSAEKTATNKDALHTLTNILTAMADLGMVQKILDPSTFERPDNLSIGT
jgi:hypothetical protein